MTSISTTDIFDETASLYITIQGPIGYLIFNRPQQKNAVNLDMWARMQACLHHLNTHADLNVVIVKSSVAGNFCAGADIAEFEQASLDKSKDDDGLRERLRTAIRNGQRQLARLSMPTVAMIDGPCIGAGCGISIHCDFRFASQNAIFGVTPAKLGILYPLNDTRHLIDLVGPSNAKRLLFTGCFISPNQALSMGLIDEVTESADELQLKTHEFVNEICSVSGYSVQSMKKIIRRVLDGQVDDDTETAQWFKDAFSGQDFQEGLTAFKAKRKPNFTWTNS